MPAMICVKILSEITFFTCETRVLPGRSRDEDTVLNGQGVGRQTLYVPVADGADVHQKGNDVQILSDRNLADLLKLHLLPAGVNRERAGRTSGGSE